VLLVWAYYVTKLTAIYWVNLTTSKAQNDIFVQVTFRINEQHRRLKEAAWQVSVADCGYFLFSWQVAFVYVIVYSFGTSDLQNGTFTSRMLLRKIDVESNLLTVYALTKYSHRICSHQIFSPHMLSPNTCRIHINLTLTDVWHNMTYLMLIGDNTCMWIFTSAVAFETVCFLDVAGGRRDLHNRYWTYACILT
jgi:hypothetical protein